MKVHTCKIRMHAMHVKNLRTYVGMKSCALPSQILPIIRIGVMLTLLKIYSNRAVIYLSTNKM